MKTNPNDLAFSDVQDSINILNVETGERSMRSTRSGLTKREYFAAMAMQGILSAKSSDAVARDAVWFADRLIIALNKETK